MSEQVFKLNCLNKKSSSQDTLLLIYRSKRSSSTSKRIDAHMLSHSLIHPMDKQRESYVIINDRRQQLKTSYMTIVCSLTF